MSNSKLDAARAKAAKAIEATETAAASILDTWLFRQEDLRLRLIAKYGHDFEKPSSTLGLNIAEAKCIVDWEASLREEILELQKPLRAKNKFIADDEIYYGATGGNLSYIFTPTSLGTIITVKEAITGKELNVTDALSWYFYG